MPIRIEPLDIKFGERSIHEPGHYGGFRAHVQGEIIFIGDYWLDLTQAEALRNWLSRVLDNA